MLLSIVATFVVLPFYFFTATNTQQGQCKFSEQNIGSRQSGIVAIDYGNESDLKTAVALVGPVSVAVDGRSNSFRVSICTV